MAKITLRITRLSDNLGRDDRIDRRILLETVLHLSLQRALS